jgi:RNA polymerase subunit RPABC4/transcription elongation factor Spt4
MKVPKVCPVCEGWIPNNQEPGAYPGAVSRRDNTTEICSACGVEEATRDFRKNQARSN